jgi:DNA modification methylase
MIQIINADWMEGLKQLADGSVHCCVTSPPYWGLRDYGVKGQLGLERTPEEFIAKVVAGFREVRRVLREDGTLWLNLGDSYNAYNGGAGPSSSLSAGTQTEQRPDLPTGFGIRCSSLKPKDMIGIPWRVALALQADGWYLRCDIIWHKPNPMPESVTDRPTKAHEYIFLMTKSERYFYDAEAVKEPQSKNTHARYGKNPIIPHKRKHGVEGECRNNLSMDQALREAILPGGRNRRSVWTVPSSAYRHAHFATFPPDLIKPCILAGCPVGGTVLDPFLGSGTTAQVAIELGRSCIGIELNPAYIDLSKVRSDVTPGLAL